jgi:hypothetical protein
MTKLSLFYTICGVVVVLFIYAAIGVAIYFSAGKPLKENDGYALYKDTMAPLVVTAAAYLGFAFQRRHSYLQALRDLWRSLIPAVQRAIQYTYRDKPDPDEYSQVMRELSTMIDSLRGVFKNIPRAGDRVGLYPFEPLKDIWRTVSWVHQGRTPDERYRARRCIRQEWYRMHSAMLKEFDREIPIKPISKFSDGEPSIIDKLIEGTLVDGDFHD